MEKIKRTKFDVYLFGEAEVGKTSICKSFDYCNIDEDYTPTVGTNKFNKNYKLATLFLNLRSISTLEFLLFA